MSASWALDVRGDVLYVGHTIDFDGAATPIYSVPVPVRGDRLGQGLDLRCPTCPGRVTVFRGGGENNVGGLLDGHDFEAEPVVIVEHDDTCVTFAEYRAWWMRKAGR